MPETAMHCEEPHQPTSDSVHESGYLGEVDQARLVRH